ncbi:hypothetical protein HHI36_007854 [Cryptolaemus montrouzieri]|uniref:Uncharacterized protein n=1 Tax=Cryptolaemus montrouzieri TaxID=559131 RepID=A0ABD2MR36_9CUCU
MFDSTSSRPSYGDDAISYVQLKRERNICTIKRKICPEHKVHVKLYAVTLIVDEDEEREHQLNVMIVLLPRKSKLSRVGTTLKFISAKDLSKGSPMLPSNYTVLEKFLEEGKKRNFSNCQLLKYQHEYNGNELFSVSMQQLVFKYKTESCDSFLSKVNLTVDLTNKIEAETRDQFKNNL